MFLTPRNTGLLTWPLGSECVCKLTYSVLCRASWRINGLQTLFVLNVGRHVVVVLAGLSNNCNEWNAKKSHTQRKNGETNYRKYHGSCTLMSLPVWDLTV